mmetsp:Transcript_1124/g.4027  ORF Transcript_1124/g.4027 Transcript_1124/m.4027 type:complete len:235 (+) Transcript_1124:58-762(+)
MASDEVADAMELRFGKLADFYTKKFPGQEQEYAFRQNGMQLIDVAEHSATLAVRPFVTDTKFVYVTFGVGNFFHLVQIAQGKPRKEERDTTQELMITIPRVGGQEAPQWPVHVLFSFFNAFCRGAPMLAPFSSCPCQAPVVPVACPDRERCQHQTWFIAPADEKEWPVIEDCNGPQRFNHLVSITEAERALVQQGEGERLWSMIVDTQGADAVVTRVDRPSIVPSGKAAEPANP